jgi:hypothetical protein
MSAEVTARVQQSETDIELFESNVKEIVDAWDRARRSLKDNPNLNLERSLWKNYFVQPEILERNLHLLKKSRNAN